MRPGEIEKAGKVSGTWQWLTMMKYPPVTTVDFAKYQRSPQSLHSMLWARQLYKQRGTGANISISNSNRPACRIMPLQISCWEVTSSSCSVLLFTWFWDFGSKSLPGLSGLEHWQIGMLTCSQRSCEIQQSLATAGVKKTKGVFKTHKWVTIKCEKVHTI